LRASLCGLHFLNMAKRAGGKSQVRKQADKKTKVEELDTTAANAADFFNGKKKKAVSCWHWAMITVYR
jgi:hypothetical protein